MDHRKKYNLIAEQISKSGVDVLFGGGWGYFIPGSIAGSKRKDEKDLIAVLKKRMKVIHTVEEFLKLDNVSPVAGLFATNHPLISLDRTPRLSKLTSKAINILSKNKKDFFLWLKARRSIGADM